MARSAVKTLTLIKSRDIVVDKLLKPCEDENHAKCTGWAVLKKEISPIDGNYFLKCICTCHRHKKQARLVKKVAGAKQVAKKVKKKAAKKKAPKKKALAKKKPKAVKKAKKGKKSAKGKKTGKARRR